MIIREACNTEIPLLVEILRTSFADNAEQFNLTETENPNHMAYCDDQRIEDDFAKGIRYYILEKDDWPCGCVAFQQASDETCYLMRLAVLPEYRNQGFGRSLINHIYETTIQMGIKRMEIGIMAQDFVLKEWYEKIGFVTKETKKFDHLPFMVEFMYKDF